MEQYDNKMCDDSNFRRKDTTLGRNGHHAIQSRFRDDWKSFLPHQTLETHDYQQKRSQSANAGGRKRIEIVQPLNSTTLTTKGNHTL